MSSIINPFRFGFPPEYITFQTTANLTTDTLSSLSIGAADDFRLVFAVFMTVDSGDNDIGGVNIGGYEAWQLANQVAPSGVMYASIWVARVPNGITADIILDNTPAQNTQVAVYTAIAAEFPYELTKNVVTDTAAGGTTLNLSVTPPSKGNILTVGGVQNGTDATLTGVDSVDFDGDIQTSEWSLIGSSTEAEGVQNITMSDFGASNTAAVAAAFALSNKAEINKGNFLHYVGFAEGLNTDTVGSFPICSAAPDRVVVITLVDIDSTGSTTSLTIGGVAATQIVKTGTANCYTSVWVAKVPTGNDVDVVFNQESVAARVDMYVGCSTDSAATIAANATVDTDQDNATNSLSISPTGTFDVVSCGTQTNGTSNTVTGLDDIVLENVDINSNEWTSVGFSFQTTGTQNVTYTNVGSTDTAAVVAAIVLN